MKARFWLGETVRTRFTFKDGETSAPVTPSGVVVRARKPDASTATYSATVTGNVAVADIPTDQAGEWWVRATATSPSAAAEEVTFTVKPTNVPSA